MSAKYPPCRDCGADVSNQTIVVPLVDKAGHFVLCTSCRKKRPNNEKGMK